MQKLHALPGSAPQAVRMRPALVLVDLLQPDRRFFSYEHGTVAEGISRVVGLIRTARSINAPILLVSGVRNREILPEIIDAAGDKAYFAHKSKLSAFSAPDFETILNAHDIDALIIGGWIRHICVRTTVADALSRGFGVMTSDEILFGNREKLNLQARRTCLDYLREHCSLHETADSLAASITAPDGMTLSIPF
ncbi:MAG: isochorismatase family protein [Candidatus Micrarchaeota archaeon]